MKEPIQPKKPKPILEPEKRSDPTKMLEADDSSSTSRLSYAETVHVPGWFKYDPTKSFEANQVRPLSLRVTDQETARVVAVHRFDGRILGAACLLNHRHILTCRHVVAKALEKENAEEEVTPVGKELEVTLTGVIGQPKIKTKVVKVENSDGSENDLALLEILNPLSFFGIQPVSFASPLRHGGKAYSVMGFPGNDQQGRNATGFLHAANAKGLVQMDRGGALSVMGGFSGAPVWSADLNAFVGLVVLELSQDNISWCIPSRRLCDFYPELPVRFRIPPGDRPVIHDYEVDDPNKELFGLISDNGQRRLTATVREHDDYFTVNVFYECNQGSPAPRGQFVTFITYPDFEEEGEDAYELFTDLKKHKNGRTWYAEQEFYPEDLFTVAAIGDGGDTALTLDLEEVTKIPWKQSSKKPKQKTGNRK
jgi:V8-like Glu-specific endopeptidase